MAPESCIVCLGEALVDLIRLPDRPGGPERFEAHSGGALANVAIGIAQAGVAVSLAGAAGTDEFGDFLWARLADAGVDLRSMRQIDGLRTPFAFVRIEAGGEPAFQIHGTGIEAGLAPHRGRERELLADAEALVVGSNTLTAEPGRSVTLAAIECAKRARTPVLFDPNLRPGRWADLDAAIELCRELAAGCLLVKANLDEARLLCGRADLGPAEAAEALADLGAELGVVTAGAAPAVAAGVARAEATPPRVDAPSPLGAGDAFMAATVAGLRRHAWDPREIGAVLPSAVEAGAAACGRVGATAS